MSPQQELSAADLVRIASAGSQSAFREIENVKPKHTSPQDAAMSCRSDACRKNHEQTALARRSFLGQALVGGVAAIAGASVTATPPALAQSTSTPDEALKALMDGNGRFVAGKLQSLDEDLSILKSNTAEKQEPFAAVLSCADSRVPVELVFDQSIGHLFVVRVAGNITTPEIIASLEYGVAVLGTKVIMVLGHGNCGAVKATIEGKPVPGQISALYAPIRPAVDVAGANLDAAIDANAKIQATLLSKASPIIAGALKDGTIKVVPARYDIATGRVSVLT
jgi:carbonic anhydrase